MPVVGGDGLEVLGVDLEEPDVGIARRGEVALVRGDLQFVHLRVRVLQRAVAHPARRLPEPNGVVVTRGREHHRRVRHDGTTGSDLINRTGRARVGWAWARGVDARRRIPRKRLGDANTPAVAHSDRRPPAVALA